MCKRLDARGPEDVEDHCRKPSAAGSTTSVSWQVGSAAGSPCWEASRRRKRDELGSQWCCLEVG